MLRSWLFLACLIRVSLQDESSDHHVPVVQGDGGDVRVFVEADVLVLTEDNFDILVLSKSIMLVEFYAPWCVHCKHLEAQIARTATLLKERQPAIPVGKVDATVNPELAKRYGVTGFPTIFLFQKGKYSEYTGSRTSEALVDFVLENADPKFKRLTHDVVTLTNATLDDFASKQEVMLLFFSSPSCVQCDQLSPEYERAARHLNKLPTPVRLAKVDVKRAQDDDLVTRYNVTRFPTLIILRRGKPYSYEGPLDEIGITAHMKSQQKPASLQVNSASELIRRAGEVDATVVGVFDSVSHPLFPLFLEAANKLRSKPFVLLHTSSSDVVRDLNATSPAILVKTAKFFQTDFDPRIRVLTLIPESSIQEILHFVYNNSLPLVGQRSSRTSWLYDGRHPICVVYYDVDFSYDGRIDTQIIRQQVESVASEYRNVTFAISKEEDFADEMKLLALDDSGQDVVVGFFVSPTERYSWIPDDDFDSQSLADFVEQVMKGSREPILKSETVVTHPTTPVLLVVGSTFKQLVTHSVKDILILFHSRSCHECLQLESVWERLASMFAPQDDRLIFAKIDASANDYPSAFQVRELPAIFHVPSASAPRVYEGERTLQALRQYVQELLDQTGSRKSEL